MILIKLIGGLGNQLFQIFTVFGYYFTYNIPVAVMPNLMGKSTYYEQWKRQLYFDSFLKNFKQYIKTDLNISSSYKEKGFNYTEIPNLQLDNSHNILLDGYFQSYKYFDTYRDNILELLNYQAYKTDVLNKLPENERNLINNEITISLHFRLGDYKGKPHFHNILPLEYYQKSLELIQSNNVASNYYVFYFYEKEDREQINSHITSLITLYPNMTFIDIVYNFEDWEQMVLMSCCSHNIIANSSFSWWGAYFNDNDNDKDITVCYPSRWFAEKGPQNTYDLCPEKWNKIII